ncbi:hypothetical protein C8Q77DRAFT_1208662 [Trametes polyzona]|nr:hypothetical protein C8Q77DRAFT_1208662 [Trametes polyzona]
MATRKLTFRSVDLGEDVTLILTFGSPSEDLFAKQFPLAWKVTTLSASGISVLNATWNNRLAFCMPQIGGDSSNLSAGTYVPIEVGQTTTLVLRGDLDPPVYHFTPPTPVPDLRAVQAKNNTGEPVTLGIGYISDYGTDYETVSPVAIWKNVGSGMTVNASITPILRAYVALGSQSSPTLRASIRSSSPILEMNMLALGSHTTVRISKDHSGAYVANLVAPGGGGGMVGDGAVVGALSARTESSERVQETEDAKGEVEPKEKPVEETESHVLDTASPASPEAEGSPGTEASTLVPA